MSIPESIDSMLMVVVVGPDGKETLGMVATPAGMLPMTAFDEHAERTVKKIAKKFASSNNCMVRFLRFHSPDTEEIFDGRMKH